MCVPLLTLIVENLKTATDLSQAVITEKRREADVMFVYCIYGRQGQSLNFPSRMNKVFWIWISGGVSTLW